MEIQLREVLSTTKRMAQIIAFHSGRSLEQVERDLDRDYFMTAQEALEYGIIDEVLDAPPRRLRSSCFEHGGPGRDRRRDPAPARVGLIACSVGACRSPATL